MKKIIMMTFAALLALNVMADNVQFKIDNMHCQNCVKRVEKALKANEAVSSVKVNLEDKAVCVSYDAEKTNVEALQKALTDVRFQAVVAKECDKKEGCKHEGCKHDGKQEGEHKCGHKDKQEGEHKCGGKGCGHEEKTQE
ncbi:MAG: heavy-metal-associated domain-containing protein [Prevotella sp.]|nr:heavy-metal-associated domain-containing protein [Prevotella sp.]